MIVWTLTLVLCTLGGLLCVVGAVGVLRFRDVYSRLHAAGVIDSGGAGLVFAGLLLWALLGDGGALPGFLDAGVAGAKPGLLQAVKLLFILMFLWTSGATSTHAVAKAAFLDGVKPWRRGVSAAEPGEGEA